MALQEGQPRKVSVAGAEASRQEWQSQALKRLREERWDEFDARQHCFRAAEVDGQ